MRYGCCVNMVTQTPDVSGVDIVPVLKEIGFDFAELSLAHPSCGLSSDPRHGLDCPGARLGEHRQPACSWFVPAAPAVARELRFRLEWNHRRGRRDPVCKRGRWSVTTRRHRTNHRPRPQFMEV